MCEGHDYCKSKEEILDWISGLYIVLLYNQVRFDAESMWEGAYVYESRIKYIPVSSMIRQLIPYRLSVTNLYLQDAMEIELGDLTIHRKKGLFRIDQETIMPYEKKNNVWVSVTVERELDLTELQRNTYTLFDFVSDLGGLQGFLFSFFAVFVGAWTFNALDNEMVANLYQMAGPRRGKSEKPSGAEPSAQRTEPI